MTAFERLLQQHFGRGTGHEQAMLAIVTFGLLFMSDQCLYMSVLYDLFGLAIMTWMTGNGLMPGKHPDVLFDVV